MAKLQIKKGDTVRVLSGKNKGMQGEVIRAYPAQNRVIVEKVNMIKRHMRPTQQNPNGSISEKEAAIDASNVMLVCPSCNKPARVGHVKDEKGNTQRVCKKCKKTF